MRRLFLIALTLAFTTPTRGANRKQTSVRDRSPRQGARIQGRRLAPRLSPEPGARQPRVPHVEDRGRSPAEARARGEDRRRAHGRRRSAPRRSSGSSGCPTSGHGRAAGDRGGRPAVQVDGEDAVQRAGSRRDARLRARQPHRDPDGRGRDDDGDEGARSPARSSSSSSPPRKVRR